MKLVKIYAFLLCLAAFSQNAMAQANLSVQGTIQKSTGATVDDGDYKLTFKLYTAETGGTVVWSEIQDPVGIVGGVYSVVLGTVTPLTPAFDQTYYLGITVGTGAELTPRSRLTASPYALSLIGQSNIFPSTGAIGAGTTTPTVGNELHVKDATADAKVLVEGATGSEIEFKKGANTASITYDGTNINIENLNLVFDAGLNLPAGQTVKYNGLADWRLIDFDDFEATAEGWQSFQPLSGTTPTGSPERLPFDGSVNVGYALGLPTNFSSYGVLKKAIDLTGIPHSNVRVVFTYHSLGSPDSEYAFAGFQPLLTSPVDQLEFSSWGRAFGGPVYQGIGVQPYSPRGAIENETVIMTTSHTGNTLVVFVGTQYNEAPSNESFAIDNVEIWVR